ncbi:MAG: FecR domain-containing protein [Nitratireductor sp.]
MITKIGWRFSTQSRSLVFAILIALPGGGLPDGALAADQVGQAEVIENSVTGGDARRIAVADPVFAAEQISADAQSHGELKLNDESLVIVGENSSVSLDDFVIEGNGFQSATLKVVKGAFRFITGNSPKNAFKIETPLSTIGVRGTVFDVYVDDGSGATRVVLLHGAVRVCTLGSACIVADRICDIVEVKSPDSIEKAGFLRGAGRSRAQERSQFSLTEQQNRFQKRFRAATATCAARAAQEATEGRSNRNKTGNASGDYSVPSISIDPNSPPSSSPTTPQ